MFEAALLVAVVAATAARAQDPEAAAALTRADAPRDAFPEGVIGLRVIATERGKKPLETVLTLLVQGTDKGTDKSLCIFREGKQKGRRILTVGDKVWLIVPGASRPVPVSKSQRLMGTASFGDIARLRFADEYDGTLRPDEITIEDASGKTRCRVIDLKAKRKGAPYPTGVLWVRTSDGLARRIRLSLASKKEAKEVDYTAYGENGRLLKMEIRDLLSSGGENVTSITFESYEKTTIDPASFTPEGAKSVP